MSNHEIEQTREPSIEWMNVLADKVNKREVMSMADKVHRVHSNFVAITAAMEQTEEEETSNTSTVTIHPMATQLSLHEN